MESMDVSAGAGAVAEGSLVGVVPAWMPTSNPWASSRRSTTVDLPSQDRQSAEMGASSAKGEIAGAGEVALRENRHAVLALEGVPAAVLDELAALADEEPPPAAWLRLGDRVRRRQLLGRAVDGLRRGLGRGAGCAPGGRRHADLACSWARQAARTFLSLVRAT